MSAKTKLTLCMVFALAGAAMAQDKELNLSDLMGKTAEEASKMVSDAGVTPLVACIDGDPQKFDVPDSACVTLATRGGKVTVAIRFDGAALKAAAKDRSKKLDMKYAQLTDSGKIESGKVNDGREKKREVKENEGLYPFTSFNFGELIGMTKDDAVKLIEEAGLHWQVSEVDGEKRPLKKVIDAKAGQIILSIKDGKVKSAGYVK